MALRPILAVLCVLGLAAASAAQDAEPHPAQQLGRRALIVRLTAPVAPIVVIAPTEARYCAAIAGWRPDLRYPVLLDNGTARAAHDIGRFVRAFEPERIVLLDAVPDEEPVTIESLRNTADRPWGLPAGIDHAERVARYERDFKHTPPGIVLTSIDDPARTAAVAIAAFRGLPIGFVDVPASWPAVLGPGDADALADAAENLAEQCGLTWRSLGDDIDAVALCLNAPVKAHIEGDSADWYALTDRLGRIGGAKDAERWAFAGQIAGDRSTAAYRAMSALFLDPGAAWLFDGYGSGSPWNTWDMTRTSEVFNAAGITTHLDDEPRNGLAAWRNRASVPLDAGIVMVNSSGNADFFNLSASRGKPGDAPLLTRPSAVHFVHSWSATRPEDADTVAGRYMSRGAFAYIGSVQEPYLQAFAPSPSFAARLLTGFAWGGAPRQIGSERWRIAVLGDPMFTLTPRPAPRAEIPDLAGIGATPLDDAIRSAAGDRDINTLARLLALGARDADAARLGRSLMDAKQGIEPATAELLTPALFRLGDRAGCLAAAAFLPAGACTEAIDAVWNAAEPMLESRTITPAQGATLERLVRSSQPEEDRRRVARAQSR